MGDLFAGPKLRFKRVQTTIEAFREATRPFLESGVLADVDELDPFTGRTLHKIKAIREVPEELSVIAAEIFEHMRSALDLAVHAATLASGRQGGKHTAFPIGDDEVHYERLLKSQCRDVPPEILETMRRSKPYKGENDALWILNVAANMGKHRILQPMGTITHMPSLPDYVGSGPVSFPEPVWNREKREMVYAITGPDTVVTMHMSTETTVSIGEIPIAAGMPAINTFNQLGTAAEDAVRAIERRSLELWPQT